MCRLISSGIVLTKQVSVKSEMSLKTKRLCVACMFFFVCFVLYCFFFLFFMLMWSICQSSAKCYSGSDIRTLEGLHCERGFLILFLRTESLAKRKEFLASQLLKGGVCEKKKRFRTNGADELEGDLPHLLNLEAVSRGKCPDCVAKSHIYCDKGNYCDVTTHKWRYVCQPWL